MPSPISTSPAVLAAPAPGQPSPASVAPDFGYHLMGGFLILSAGLQAGQFLHRAAGLILPANILGLFILLTLLGLGLIPLRFVESAALWLLWLLPLLFLPVFTVALKDRTFWLAQGREVAGAIVIATLLLWAFVGHLAQWLLAKSAGPPRHPPAAALPTLGPAPSGVPASLLLLPGSLAWFHGMPGWSWQPVLWSITTIAVYFGCRWVFLRTRWPILHPALTGILVLLSLIEAAGGAYAQFQAGTAWIDWLLGPAVVAMAVPIYQLRGMVRANAHLLSLVIPLGLGFAAATTTALLAAAGRPREVVAAGALKSITSPVGIRLALDAHVSADAAVAGILIAGMLGATAGPTVLHWLRVRDERAVGLALGCTSHGIGVARALELGPAAGAFASLGMSGTAMLGALVLPYVLRKIAGAG